MEVQFVPTAPATADMMEMTREFESNTVHACLWVLYGTPQERPAVMDAPLPGSFQRRSFQQRPPVDL